MDASERNIYTNTLVHLPAQKQKELAIITRYIHKAANPEMIILFGSHATDRWVTDHYTNDGTVYEYNSDYDILVVTPHKRNYGDWVWPQLREKIRRDPRLGRTTLIHHSISVLNEKVRDRYYFFVDIYQEGVLLYDSGKCQLEGPQPLDPEKRKKKAEEYLTYWWQKGDDSMKGVEFYMGIKRHNEAAFNLHQAAERYYAGFLLVFTDHKPKTHDLEELGEVASRVNRQLAQVFPRRTEQQQRVFELLRKAYKDSRYDKNYSITPGELKYLQERVELLRTLVQQLAQAEIDMFAQKAAAGITE